jgi:hypothetical protein
MTLIGDGYRRTNLISASGVSTITISGGQVALGTSDHTIQGLSLKNIRLRIFNYTAWLRVLECSFVADGQTYNGIESINSSGFGGEATRTDNVQINNCRFFGQYKGIALDQSYLEVEISDNYFKTITKNAIVVGQSNSALGLNHAKIFNNTIIGVGAGSNVTYISGIQADGTDIEVYNNYLSDISNANYWEVDGIYTKAVTGHITNNTLVNAGYRTSIQNKQIDLNGTTPTKSMLINGNSIFFDKSNTGYSGATAGIFAGVSNVYGGINIVSDNTTVSDNIIIGAGYPIYNANSERAWLMNNISILNNTIISPRGAWGIFLTGAGVNWTISGNCIKSPTKTLTGHEPTFSGIALWLKESYYSTFGYWVESEQQYIDRKVSRLTITNNDVNVTMSNASGVYGIDLEARDLWAGGAMPTYPASFDYAMVSGNTINANNTGAGTGYAFLIQNEAARFTNCYFDSVVGQRKNNSATPS